MNARYWQLAVMALLLGAAMPATAADTAATVAAIAAIRSSSGASHSPDGKSIAYISNTSGSPQVWVLGADGHLQVTRLADPVQSVDWNPSGDWLAYDTAPGGGLNVQVHVVRPDGTGDRLVTSGGSSNNWLFGWTKDGKALRIGSAAADPSRFEPQLICLASGAVTKVGEGSAGLQSFEVSEDGHRIVIDRAVTRGDGNILLADGSGGPERHTNPAQGPSAILDHRIDPQCPAAVVDQQWRYRQLCACVGRHRC